MARNEAPELFLLPPWGRQSFTLALSAECVPGLWDRPLIVTKSFTALLQGQYYIPFINEDRVTQGQVTSKRWHQLFKAQAVIFSMSIFLLKQQLILSQDMLLLLLLLLSSLLLLLSCPQRIRVGS